MDVPGILKSVENLELTTDRLLIRRFRRDDLEIALEHELDRRIMRYIRDPLPREEVAAKTESFLGPWQAREGEWLGLPMVRAGEASMLGIVALRITSVANETIEIGYRIHPDHQRQGLTLEACKALLGFLFGPVGAHKVIAYCAGDNQASARLMEKLGMTFEGRLRQHSRLQGAWCDELLYAILASDPR